MNRVLGVELTAGGDIVASDLSDGSVRESQHRLFYKFDNDTLFPIEYTILVISQGGGLVDDTNPYIETGNLQWGYRTFADTYVLDTDPTTNECS